MGIFDKLKSSVAIDAGSSNFRIAKNQELVFNEPTILSIDTENQKVSGVGKNIKEQPPNMSIRPVDYVIADFQAFESCLRGSIKQALNSRSWFPRSYRFYISIPKGATEVEKRAYRDSAEHAGAIEVYMMHSPCMAAAGLNILFERKNFILVDFSSSKFEITGFYDSLPVAESTIRFGTSHLENLIVNHIRRTHGLNIGMAEVEMILNGYPSKQTELNIQFKPIPLEEIHSLIESYLIFVDNEVSNCLEVLISKNANNSISNGIYFTGGGTFYKSICAEIATRKGLNYQLSSTPLLDNINGVKQVIADSQKFERYLMQ